jgi:hypothetical protein
MEDKFKKYNVEMETVNAYLKKFFHNTVCPPGNGGGDVWICLQ